VAPGANTTGCATGSGLQNLTGQTLPESPKNKISVNALYRLHFDPGALTLSGTFVWKDSEYNSPFNRYYNFSPAYSQVNLRATFTDTKNRYSVIVFADNVFNTTGYDGTGGIPVTNPGPEQVVDRLVSYTAPRTYGVEFQYRFR
jgi:iron complex outermembrane receptor protein